MIGPVGHKAVKARTLMGRLRSDVRGNTLMIMAMAMIPLCALAGSGVDTARLYVVKVRLQQACDAGVLAGRKFMVDGSATLDANAATQAQRFFTNNFTSGWMTTSAVNFTPVKANDSEVNGTATATVPMSIMKMFGAGDATLSVTCTARYDVADTDIMFVLDTTASMACLPGGPDSCGTGTYNYNRPATSYPQPSSGAPAAGGAVPGYAGSSAVATNELTSNGKNVSRIEALRQAVLAFYDAFTANADPSTHVRYGFVTYSSSVNVGQAILDESSSYLNDTPNYQSRHVIDDYVISTTIGQPNSKSADACNATGTRAPSTPLTYGSDGTAQRTGYNVLRTGTGRHPTQTCYTVTATVGPKWEYKQLPIGISPLLSGNVMNDPTKIPNQSLKWFGCVETPVDNPGQTNFDPKSPPSELDPDLQPTGSKRWWPHLQNVEYKRSGGTTSEGDDSGHPSMGDTGKGSQTDSGYVACGKPAKRLGEMTRDQVNDFVHATDFVPEGGTYHDIGMIWGARLISPTGLWGKDTQAWPGRNAPNRIIVFMTDGIMAPTTDSYSMYGIETYDQRVSNSSNPSNTTLINLHNNRFLAACAAAKQRNIDVWTVAIAKSASDQMQNCASSPTQAIFTTTGQGLTDAFKSIAQHLAMLRLTH